MARRTFSNDELLDAARDAVLERGPRAATVATIAARAGAPTGSIYHRFATVDDLIAQCWLRAVQRTQEITPAASHPDEPVEHAVQLALAAYDHCLDNPADAVLLDKLRRPDVLHLKLSAEVRAAIEALDVVAGTTIRDLATSLFGNANAVARDRVVLAVVDLPYGVAQRYLVTGRRPPKSRREQLPAAVRAILTD